MLLITGANGKLGRLIVEEVLRRAPDAPLAVSVRDASAAADLTERGVDVRQADYHGLDSIRAAFTGADRLLLMPTPATDREARVAEMTPVVHSAAEVGVKHVVYPGAADVEGLDFPAPELPHAVVRGDRAQRDARHAPPQQHLRRGRRRRGRRRDRCG
jgi:NAD(P)H dehydrogenase (quinone)